MGRRHIQIADAGPTVGDVMYLGPRTLAAEETVATARAELAHPRTVVVLVCDGPRYLGSVTSADLPEAVGDDVPVRDVARPDAPRVGPADPVARALAVHAEHGTSRIPVVDEAGELAGLVCITRSGEAFCVATAPGAVAT